MKRPACGGGAPRHGFSRCVPGRWPTSRRRQGPRRTRADHPRGRGTGQAGAKPQPSQSSSTGPSVGTSASAVRLSRKDAHHEPGRSRFSRRVGVAEQTRLAT